MDMLTTPPQSKQSLPLTIAWVKSCWEAAAGLFQAGLHVAVRRMIGDHIHEEGRIHTKQDMKWNAILGVSVEVGLCSSANCCCFLVVIFQPGNLTCVCMCPCACVCVCADYSTGQWDKRKCCWTVLFYLCFKNVSLKSFEMCPYCLGSAHIFHSGTSHLCEKFWHWNTTGRKCFGVVFKPCQW